MREAVLVFSIFVLSLVVRLAYLMRFPVFRFDELGENLRAFMILRGYMPLTNNAPFIGALYNYLAATAYYVIGDPVAFRLLVALFGSLTPPLLYVLARKLTQSSVIPVVSALTLALMPPHILIASHVAWSASLTPFFFTLSLLFFVKALEGDTVPHWLGFGVATGLAIQTHPSVLASYAGILAGLTYVLGWREVRNLVTLKRFTAFTVGFLVGYANMVVFNVVQPLGSIIAVFSAKWTGLGSPLTPAEYLRRLAFLAGEFVSMFPAGVPVITLPHLLKSVAFYVFMMLFLSFITYSAIRTRFGRGLLIYIGVALLLLAIGTKGVMAFNIFGYTWGPHYLQHLTPLVALAVGIGVDALLKDLKGVVSRVRTPALRRLGGYLSKSCVLVALLFVLLWPFTTMLGILAYLDSAGCTNRPFLETVGWLEREFTREVPVYTDISKAPSPHLMLYELLVLESFRVYPHHDKLLRELLKEPYKAREYLLKEFRRFLDDVRDEGVGVMVVGVKTSIEDIRQYLPSKEYEVTAEYPVISCFRKPLYKLVVIEFRG